MDIDPESTGYGYYPRTMIRLATIAYMSMSEIPAAVRSLGLNVVWGPAELVKDGEAYSAMFVCMRNDPREYTTVIRGTNLMSWWSWTSEDFDIGTMKPFNLLAPHAPSNALVSEGTFNGITDLLALRDPKTGAGVVDFLRAANPQSLFVTGHSLGGTLTPPLFALLNDLLYGSRPVANMTLWSFAGLTPGDGGFNTYFNTLFNPGFPWRLHNTLDIAPFCWWSYGDIENVYARYNLRWDSLDKALFDDLFAQAKGNGYAQPRGDLALPGTFSTWGLDPYIWELQAIYQHHTSTYQILVDTAYPSAQELAGLDLGPKIE